MNASISGQVDGVKRFVAIGTQTAIWGVEGKMVHHHHRKKMFRHMPLQGDMPLFSRKIRLSFLQEGSSPFIKVLGRKRNGLHIGLQLQIRLHVHGPEI